MYQREALWIQFQSRSWRPNAVKVGAGRINAVTGKPLTRGLRPGEQDYMVCPPQPWLDGFHTGDGTIRQFVAAPLGLGVTVEEGATILGFCHFEGAVIGKGARVGPFARFRPGARIGADAGDSEERNLARRQQRLSIRTHSTRKRRPTTVDRRSHP